MPEPLACWQFNYAIALRQNVAAEQQAQTGTGKIFECSKHFAAVKYGAPQIQNVTICAVSLSQTAGAPETVELAVSASRHAQLA